MAIKARDLNDGENVVFSVRTHPKALIVPVLTLVVLLAVGVTVELLVESALLGWTVWAVVVVLAPWRFGWPLLEWLTSTYTVTDRRLITRHGVITQRGHDIPLSRISDVAYELDLVDRVLGCGTLVISDASTHGRVVLHDIPDVRTAQSRLNDLLHDVHGTPRGREEGH